MPTYRTTYLKDFACDRIAGAYRSLRGSPPPVSIDVRQNDRPNLGDYATNIAMAVAKSEGVSPRTLADELAHRLGETVPRDELTECVAAGPGFLNLFVSPARIQETLRLILADGADYGRRRDGQGKRLQVEFVSSNPTGPLTVGHGRQAVLGDVHATLGDWVGWNVRREYYFNDEGRQIELLTDSAAERLLECAFGTEPEIPENGYAGEYLKEMAVQILAENDEIAAGIEQLRQTTAESIDRVRLYQVVHPEAIRHEVTERIIRTIKEDLGLLGVGFDTWFSETTLHRSGEVDAALKALHEHNGAYEEDGAVWLAAEAHGGAKNSVLIRSDGRPTYLMVDVAYHINKHERGFDRVVDVQGADHHAEQTCVKAALRILGYPEEFLDYELHQFVSLKAKGELQRMSTRAGRFVTLRDLIDELGKDIIRWFMISRKPEAHLDFDLDLARAESVDNPATYIQYAHTRIASIFRKAGDALAESTNADLSLLVEHEELELIKTLDRFPEVIRTAAEDFAPHLLAEYGLNLSRALHAYYDKHRILGDNEDLSRARLALLHGLQTVLANTLAILGMDAPEEM